MVRKSTCMGRICTSQNEITQASIADMKDKLLTLQKQVLDTRSIADKLAISTCSLQVRKKELAFDYEVVKKQQEDAKKDKERAITQLKIIGGIEYERQLILQTLDIAKKELEDTNKEKDAIVKEELELRTKLAKLNHQL